MMERTQSTNDRAQSHPVSGTHHVFSDLMDPLPFRRFTQRSTGEHPAARGRADSPYHRRNRQLERETPWQSYAPREWVPK